MILLPAIDLYEKKVVRLYKGSYDKMTVYSDDPAAMAKTIAVSGALWLHVVDLEGAKTGDPVNLDVIREIAGTSGMKVEMGGGIRTFETIEKVLEAGVSRVILGTKALEDEPFLIEVLQRYGDAIAVGVDARDGKVATHGWLNTSDTDAETFIAHLAELGVKTVIATDISKDGAMSGTNLPFYERLKPIPLNIIASGGVSSLQDIQSLAKIGVHGAILGKAMYTGAVTLADALKAAEEGV